MLISFLALVINSFSVSVQQLSGNSHQSLLLAALTATGAAVVLSRRKLRKAKRKLLWIAVKNMFSRKRSPADNKGALKVSLIILGILLAAMMIHFLSWIGVILSLLILLPLLFIRKKRRRKY